MSHTSLEPAEPADASLGDLVRNMSADLSRLVRNEVQLAQTEITEKLKHAGAGVGAFGGAGVLALYGVGGADRGCRARPGPGAARLARCVDRRRRGSGHRRYCGAGRQEAAHQAVPERAVASVKTDVAEIKESIKQ